MIIIIIWKKVGVYHEASSLWTSGMWEFSEIVLCRLLFGVVGGGCGGSE